MKTLIQAITCAAILLSSGQLQAKPYGGFKPGMTFSMKVTEVTIKIVDAKKTPEDTPIPSGVPKFTKDQVVNFTIGTKGQLKAKDMSIPFERDAKTSNHYDRTVKDRKALTDHGQVFKTAKNKPIGGILSFARTSYPNFTKTVTIVTYKLTR